ncbi:MAG: polymerase sigma-70 factor [Mucilaginibacter sp.]|nr:polymerase sigma-70 factor [Mucilaginibacter sp.]
MSTFGFASLMALYDTLTDVELTAFLRDGDHTAFNEIYERYWQTLYQTAYNLLKDNDGAHDVVQEIFVWLWTNRDRQLTDSLQPYLRAAVKYQIAKLVRHGKVKAAFYNRTVANYEPVASSDQNYEVRELQAIIAAFTQSLPDKAREIYRLSREELLTNKEIAIRLNISEKTVENQMTINLRKLRLALGKMSFWSILL